MRRYPTERTETRYTGSGWCGVVLDCVDQIAGRVGPYPSRERARREAQALRARLDEQWRKYIDSDAARNNAQNTKSTTQTSTG